MRREISTIVPIPGVDAVSGDPRRRDDPAPGPEDQGGRQLFFLHIRDRQMFEVMRRNADALALLGADDLFAEAVRELVEDMKQWIAEGQLPAAVEPRLEFVAYSIAGGGFQIAAHMADAGVSDADAAARFCTRLLLDGLRGMG